MPFVFTPFALLGVALVVGGLLMVRSQRSSRWVAVPGRVVDRSFLTTPTRVTVEYPAPDGAPLRARVSAGLMGGLRGPEVGADVTVYVDPRRPTDVTLGPSSATTTYGWAFVAMGAFALVTFLRISG
ncbi:DUF3592 domain-containing protein [Actinotalea ferrariae]|uniref:DUF3592 domain-containing protein n=1 Tax=Actinotalea ferrariae TaxID=1386098 RepID=UPI001C8C43F7|nr:DUF3592 domain-containing protein [Actinotalea ferrariae]MBX9244717.1 DUF3592 domain-containing protein [Actinotalea ferrariae]